MILMVQYKKKKKTKSFFSMFVKKNQRRKQAILRAETLNNFSEETNLILAKI